MRVIGGKLRGKLIHIPIDKTTRPLKDMVRESIFNILEHSNNEKIKFNNDIILDLFSGSGSFGLEALSRGAKKCLFVENYTKAFMSLNENIKKLKCHQSCLITKLDCFEFIENLQKNELKLDIIFLDPPYREEKINFLIEKILKKNILNRSGIIIIHRHRKDNIRITEKMNIIDLRLYGVSKIIFGN